MVFLNADNSHNQGMTLLEMVIALVIAGILAAVSIPSLMGMLTGNKVKSAEDQVQNALRDAQRQAIRRSRSCTITINHNTNPVTITASESGCLVTSDKILPKDVKVRSSGSYSFTFSFKGHTSNASTLSFYADNLETKRCIAIAAHLGIMRSGIYSDNTSVSSPTASNCKTSSNSL